MVIINYDTKDHKHAPNLEEVAAVKIVARSKRRAEEHPETLPAQILRTELRDVPAGYYYKWIYEFFLKVF